MWVCVWALWFPLNLPWSLMSWCTFSLLMSQTPAHRWQFWSEGRLGATPGPCSSSTSLEALELIRGWDHTVRCCIMRNLHTKWDKMSPGRLWIYFIPASVSLTAVPCLFSPLYTAGVCSWGSANTQQRCGDQVQCKAETLPWGGG